MRQDRDKAGLHEPARVLVPLLEGFEEIEAVTLIDVLRRGGLDVLVAGDRVGSVRGAHDLMIETDLALDDVNGEALSAIVLPGGARASASLAAHPRVQQLLEQVTERGGYTCAMCAAPMALAAAGLHFGRTLTSHPKFESYVEGAGEYVNARVVVDGPVVTSRSPGTAMEFALTLVGLLRGKEKEFELEDSMLVERATEAYRPQKST